MTPPSDNEFLDPGRLLARALDYREMALTATTPHIADGLIRLAERFEALATALEKVGSAGRE